MWPTLEMNLYIYLKNTWLDIPAFLSQFYKSLLQTRLLEFLAVISGIVSVAFSRKENILVYPTGLINTTFYIYLSLKESLLGEAAVNLYYTIMSIYGWWLWIKKDVVKAPLVKITTASKREWAGHILFFGAFFIIIYLALSVLKKSFAPGTIPWADAFASASAFTGMWLMAKKKVESWIWWILTDIASMPLYYVKGYAFTTVYYFILLIMAVAGLIEWRRRASNYTQLKTAHPNE